MADEERDVPDLVTLSDDAKAAHERLDAGVAAAKGDPVRLGEILASFLQNDLMPLLRDGFDSTLLALEQVEDQVNPITIPQRVAEDNAALLLALKSSNAGNPELVARIDEVLEHLDLDDGDPEDGDEEET